MSNVLKFNPLSRKLELAAKPILPINGVNGEKGETGLQGIQGARGPRGKKGEQGIQGIAGLDGLNGKDGMLGEKGEQGTIGLAGLNGKDGTEIYYVARMPDSSMGVDGEWCFNSLKETFRKENGVWKFYAQFGGGITRAAVQSMIDSIPPAVGGSGITRVVSSVAVNTNAAAVASTDYVYLLSAGAILTMPTAVGNTNRYSVKNTAASSASINFTGGQTGDGSATITLAQNISVDLISNNSNWLVL